MGREHVPDPLGLFIKTGLVSVTQGNLIGGAGLVGAVYWFVYFALARARLTAKLPEQRGGAAALKTDLRFVSGLYDLAREQLF